ncbi:MAG: hypothetical protein U5L96_18750 [Owenweeksia sp.]|nr:hypothetical protein [Owenweeksia sp.]
MRLLASFCLILVVISSNAQWTYKTLKNDFDGNIKIASVSGKGSDYPYTEPMLVLNRYENRDDVFNFYIVGAGYYPNNDVSVMLKFDGEDDTYMCTNTSISKDGKSLFISEFMSLNNNTRFYLQEILKKIKEQNRLSVRITNDYGSSDLVFGLSGSSRAVNYVMPDLNQTVEFINDVKVKQEKKEKQDSETVAVLLDTARSIGLDESSLNTLEWQLEQFGSNSKVAIDVDLSKVVDIEFVEGGLFPDSYNLTLIYEDGTRKNVGGDYKLK